MFFVKKIPLGNGKPLVVRVLGDKKISTFFQNSFMEGENSAFSLLLWLGNL